MKKKIYTAPKINVVEMSCTTIMAGSYGIEEDGTSVSGTLGSESVSSGDSWEVHTRHQESTSIVGLTTQTKSKQFAD